MEEEYGPIATKLIFENDRVRVWELFLEPGETLEMHHHKNPYLYYTFEDSEIEFTNVDGSIEYNNQGLGKIVWSDGGRIHKAKNIGNKSFKEVLVEFK